MFGVVVTINILELWRLHRELAAVVERHRQRLVVLENHAPRRFAVEVTNLAVGEIRDVPVTWDPPLPAIDYTPLVTVSGGNNAGTVLRTWAVPNSVQPGAKTESSCLIRVNNTGATPIASVGLDVVAVRGT